MSSDMPERIWAKGNTIDYDETRWSISPWNVGGVEYVRNDLVKIRTEQLEHRLLQCATDLQIYMDAYAASEAKLAKAVAALRGWIEFANEEGMPVSLFDLEAAELTGENT